VTVRIANSELAKGATHARNYLAWKRPNIDESTDCVAAFKDEVLEAFGAEAGSFEEVPFIKAFIRSTLGYEDNLPTHYPRLTTSPEAEDKNYEWFVANAKGARGPLGDVVTDAGLKRQG
jgi:hypothetical protein